MTILMESLLTAYLMGAPPAVLIVGGGWGPDGNQVSIEVHTQELARIFESRSPQVLFGAGSDTLRTVQVRSADKDPVSEGLLHIFGDDFGLFVDYRSTNIKGAKRADVSHFKAALTTAAQAEGGSVMFGIGHGGTARKNTPSKLYLWGPDQEVKPADIRKILDDAGGSGPHAFVLGQCGSGGLADAMFAVKKKRQLGTPTACVLAAIPRDRLAAGCTDDVNDPDAKAYMAVTAAAFDAGYDLDGDGQTSLLEAHTYARIYDRTTDVPVSSSEIYLLEHAFKTAPTLDDVSYEEVLEMASVEDRAVLEGLLTEEPKDLAKRVAQAEAWIKKAKAAKKAQGEADKKVRTVRRRVRFRLYEQFPELTNRDHSKTRAWLAGDAAEILKAAEADPEWSELEKRTQARVDFNAKQDIIRKTGAQWERWLRTARRVVAEAWLKKNGSTIRRRHLEALEACERMVP